MVFNPEAIERSCQDFVSRLIKFDILIKNKHNLSQRGSRNASRWRGMGGLFPYKSDGAAPRKTSKISLKGTRMYFCGYGLKGGNNSRTTNQLALVISILTELTLPKKFFFKRFFENVHLYPI